MKIPFLLLSCSDGSPMPGVASQIAVIVSKDGGAFVASTYRPTQFAPGYYQVELTDAELDVTEYAIIEITCPGAQKIVKQYTPDASAVVDVDSVAAAVWNAPRRTLTFDGGTPQPGSGYCTVADVYAHWTQSKIDAWAGSADAIEAAINWSSLKIDSDLKNATTTPFNPVPPDIRTLCVMASGVRLARLAGALEDPAVLPAIEYYKEFVENYNYFADNQQP